MTLAIRQRTFVDALIREPVQLAISQPHQVAISAISVSLMGKFFASSGAVPWQVALIGAVGVEYAYLKGLSDAAYARSLWGKRLVWAAFLIIVIAGISVLLRDAYHVAWMVAPSAVGAVVLAVLHILPLAYIGLCSANLHMEAEAQRVAADREAADRAEARRRDDEDYERRRRQRRAELEDEIAAEKARKLAEVEAMEAGTLARRRLREQAATNAPNTSAGGPPAAPGTGANTPREQLRGQVARTLREHPKANRAQLARELGIGRTTLYELIAEAQRLGEL